MTTQNKGRTPVSFSEACKGVMVRITWTTAPVVRITARQALTLDCQIVAVVRGTYTVMHAHVGMQVAAGKMLHFVASGRGDGWYYVVQTVSNESKCSCPAHHNPKSTGCAHLEAVCTFCQNSEHAEFARAGVGAHTELETVECKGFIYPMVRVVSPTYTGKLHYTWTDNKINCSPMDIIAEIEAAVAAA